ncbi:MAG TPA: hypothetical protein VG965_04525 [Patescibacteria group bacterium]|nr:hypothetical protein [Patescibacteria group bacterium]
MVVERRIFDSRERSFADYEESEGSFVSLPYSDLEWSSIPPDNEVYPFIHYFIPIERLAGIRQLGFLSYSGDLPQRYIFKPYSHQREDHEWGVAMTADAIAKTNEIKGKPLTTLRFATLLHDVASVSGGDAVKSVDPVELDEETHWRDVVGGRGKRLMEKRGVDLSDIDSVLQNEGTLGQILDVADRITYVMKDTYNILGPHQSRVNSDYDLLNLRMILAKNPMPGNIYKDIRVEEETGDVFFTNPDNLYNFLLLRALLHKQSYMHPLNMGRDMIIADLVKPFYSRTDGNKLTPKKLRNMDDAQFMSFLGKNYQEEVYPGGENFGNSVLGQALTSALINTYPEYIKYDSQEDAESGASQLAEDGMQVIGVKMVRGFKTGTDYKVSNGTTIAPFKDAYPQRASEIDGMSQEISGNYVFYLDGNTEKMVDRLVRKAHSLVKT